MTWELKKKNTNTQFPSPRESDVIVLEYGLVMGNFKSSSGDSSVD